MRERRTELRDELAALIAAGRELSPDHDQALAEVFVDRVAGKVASPVHSRRLLTLWARPRHLIAAVMVSLACFGTVSVVASHHAGSAQEVRAQPSGKVPDMPVPGKVPALPVLPKVPPPPQAPAPKGSP